MPPDVERRTIEECRRFGEPLPDKIKNRPQLHLGLVLYLNAWFELDTERTAALAQIKRSDIFAYAHDYGLSEEQTEDLWFYVRQMDGEHLKRVQAKMPKTPKGKRGSGE